MSNQTALVNGIKWTCEVPEPRYGNVRPRWAATLGPVTLAVRLFTGYDGAPDIWVAHIECGEEFVEMTGPVSPTASEAMIAAGPCARETLRRWRDLGALAGEALSTMGEP